MVIFDSKVRVRYGETDKMGYAYYGIYPQYYEVGRTELIRNFGLSYKKLEDDGIMLPVLSLDIKYLKPAFYDDLLTIKTKIVNMPVVRIEFEYEVYNQNNELLNTGKTTLVFIDAQTRKPRKAPEDFLRQIGEYFE
ncbi:MAG: thioesterase family protein [Bacteroidota bacterium]